MSAPGFFTFDREAIFNALFTRVQAAYPWANTPARRVKLWGDVPPEERPALFQFEGHDEVWDWPTSANPKVVLEASLFVYVYAPRPDVIGSTLLNQVLAAIGQQMLPSGPDLTTGRQTLGGLVHSARIQGTVSRVPGDLDDDGMAIVPIRILVNA